MEVDQDFGELLVDIGDRLNGDLPLVTRRWRVFRLATIERFSIFHPTFSLLRETVPDVEGALLHPVHSEIQLLSGKSASQMQQERANSLFQRELFRRYCHADRQYFIWRHSALAGGFFGGTLSALLICGSTFMLTTGHRIAGGTGLAIFLFLQAVSGFALRNAK